MLALHPTQSLALTAGAYVFWRNSRADGIDTLAGSPLAPPTNRQRFVGWQPMTQLSWQTNSHVIVNAAFEPSGATPSCAQPATRSIGYAALWTTLRF